MAAQVAAVSTPPCDPHTLVPLLEAFEPSLQTTVSIALMRMWWRRWCPVLSAADGPVCTPRLARSAVSVTTPCALKCEFELLRPIWLVSELLRPIWLVSELPDDC